VAPELLEAGGLGLGEAPVGEVGERRSPPEGQRLPEAALLLQSLEALQIELVGRKAQQVAGRHGLQALPAEELAELGDVHLQRLGGGLGRLSLPEGVDQAVARDDLVPVEQQDGQQTALLGAPKAHRPRLGVNLERPKDAELHRYLGARTTELPERRALSGVYGAS